jgi:uncharacterized protein (DUF2147 family)
MNQILILALLFSLKGYSQNADAIIGKWLKTNKEDLIIEVYKINEEYEGKISWSKDNKKPVGFLMLENLRYNQKTKKWEGGKIHDPNSGHSYTAIVTMNSDSTLEVSGAVLFFRSKRDFKRVK